MNRLDALEQGLGAIDGADEVEIAWLGGRSGTARFAESQIIQSSVLEQPVVQVRVALGRRVGVCRGSATSRSALAELGRQALELARRVPEVPSFPGFADPAPIPAVPPAFSPATAALGPGERADQVAALFARAARRGLVCAGAFTSGATETGVANSRGVRAWHESSFAKLELIAAAEGASGYATFYGRDVAALDAERLCQTACDKAIAARRPREIPPGAYDVVLEPPAVVEVLEWMAMTSFGARSVEEGSSFLCGRQGELLTGEAVTFADDALAGHEGVPPMPFDSEGVPKERVVFVGAGRAGGPCHDRRSAARAGLRSTGHAPPPSDDAEGPVATHLEMVAGQDDREDLLGRVERGLLVTRFHYVNGLLDPPRALQTGMTRDGLFWIEEGRPGGAVRNLRFTESLLEAFARLGGATRARQAVGTSWMGAYGAVAPTVLLRGFHFTGTSR